MKNPQALTHLTAKERDVIVRAAIHCMGNPLNKRVPDDEELEIVITLKDEENEGN